MRESGRGGWLGAGPVPASCCAAQHRLASPGIVVPETLGRFLTEENSSPRRQGPESYLVSVELWLTCCVWERADQGKGDPLLCAGAGNG